MLAVDKKIDRAPFIAPSGSAFTLYACGSLNAVYVESDKHGEDLAQTVYLDYDENGAVEIIDAEGSSFRAEFDAALLTAVAPYCVKLD